MRESIAATLVAYSLSLCFAFGQKTTIRHDLFAVTAPKGERAKTQNPATSYTAKHPKSQAI